MFCTKLCVIVFRELETRVSQTQYFSFVFPNYAFSNLIFGVNYNA